MSNRTAPTFWFAERGFENSLTPCICMDNPTGGDPIIIAQIVPNEFWRNYVNAMCDAATVTFRIADELSGYLKALNEIAEGRTPPDQNGHYLAHRDSRADCAEGCEGHGVSAPALTEGQIDHAAFLFASEGLEGLRQSATIHDLLTQNQIDALVSETREAVKTSLMFSLMNHLDGESFA